MRIENPYTQFASERPLVWTSQCSRKLTLSAAPQVLFEVALSKVASLNANQQLYKRVLLVTVKLMSVNKISRLLNKFEFVQKWTTLKKSPTNRAQRGYWEVAGRTLFFCLFS